MIHVGSLHCVVTCNGLYATFCAQDTYKHKAKQQSFSKVHVIHVIHELVHVIRIQQEAHGPGYSA